MFGPDTQLGSRRLPTFEEERLPSYLGHGVKVAAASVRGVWDQPEDSRRTENQAFKGTVHPETFRNQVLRPSGGGELSL